MESDHRKLVFSLIAVAAVALLVTAAALRRSPANPAAKPSSKSAARPASEVPPQLALLREPPPKPLAFRKVDTDKQAKALHDATLLDLIRNARVAARTNDRATRTAMLTGLRREPDRARALIVAERERAPDTDDIAELTRLYEDLR